MTSSHISVTSMTSQTSVWNVQKRWVRYGCWHDNARTRLSTIAYLTSSSSTIAYFLKAFKATNRFRRFKLHKKTYIWRHKWKTVLSNAITFPKLPSPNTLRSWKSSKRNRLMVLWRGAAFGGFPTPSCLATGLGVSQLLLAILKFS